MGTRGLVVLRKDGIDKGFYNHYDSYPEGLGKEIIDIVRNESTSPKLLSMFDAANVIGEGGIESWDKYLEAFESRGTANGLKKYCDIDICDYTSFIYNSLFCEYAYIINLDTNCIEYYVGFQREGQDGNRYQKDSQETGDELDEFYPCRLVKVIPFKALNDKRKTAKTIFGGDSFTDLTLGLENQFREGEKLVESIIESSLEYVSEFVKTNKDPKKERELNNLVSMINNSWKQIKTLMNE